MPTHAELVPTAEAAFIAGLTDRQMNRVIDESLVPEALFEHQGSLRRFTRLCSAFASFYFDTENLLLAAARRDVLSELTERVQMLRNSNEVLSLVALPDEFTWKVSRQNVEIDLAPYVTRAFTQARRVDEASTLVTCDPDIMGGDPVFAGTRVPIDVVLSSLSGGIEMDRLQASWPFLTDAHIEAARLHQKVRPRRGRPRRLEDVNPAAIRRVTRAVRPARA